jgi:hypothetical protein
MDPAAKRSNKVRLANSCTMLKCLEPERNAHDPAALKIMRCPTTSAYRSTNAARSSPLVCPFFLNLKIKKN